MKFNILTILLIGLSSFLFGQEKGQELYYKISKEVYTDLKKGTLLTVDYINTLPDSIAPYCYNYYPEDLGYFIGVSMKQEYLETDLFANPSFGVKMIPHAEDLLIKVIDSLGQPVEKVKVSYGGKKMRFKKAQKAYRLKNWNPSSEREVCVQTKEEIAFFDVSRGADDAKKIDFKTFVNRVKYRIRRKWRNTKYWFLDTFIWEEKVPYKGYMVLNKPKFRPNDSIKVKGYFLNHKGKPINKPLVLKLFVDYTKIKWQTTIYPQEKGVFTATIPLSDSLNLTLNKSYKLAFEDSENEIDKIYFTYEDYQLDEVFYSLASDKETYLHGDKIRLQVDGLFATGHRIADGDVKIEVYGFLDDYFNRRKTKEGQKIWGTSQSLSPNKPTSILIPTAGFPKERMILQIVAHFNNSNGELQKKEQKVKFRYTEWHTSNEENAPIQLQLTGDFVTASFKDTTRLSTELVDWKMEVDHLENNASKTVALPYQERVNAFARYYEACVDTLACTTLHLSYFPHQVAFSGKRVHHQLQLKLANPRRLTINYQLYKGKQLVADKTTDKANMTVLYDTKSRAEYTLHYQFYWAGELEMERAIFKPSHKILQLSVKQPDNIVPGSTVPIQIKVTHKKHRKTKGVNLTAGSVNGRFGKVNTYNRLDYPYKKNRKTPYYKSYPYRDRVITADGLPEYWTAGKKWLQKTQTQNQPYYQLRHPDNGFYLRTIPIPKDSIYEQTAQFSPFVVKDGQSQPIYLIYCNGQLVYYYGIKYTTPYAFIGKAGINQITIRTREYVYEATVNLAHGEKTIFSIDAAHLDKINPTFKVTRTKTIPRLTEAEKQHIKQPYEISIPSNSSPQVDSKMVHIKIGDWQELDHPLPLKLALQSSDELIYKPDKLWKKFHESSTYEHSPYYRTIQGFVTDDAGDPLIGASVLIKGTTMGTVTDLDGSYSLPIPKGRVILVISYTGYATQNIHIFNQPYVNVELNEGLELSEVNVAATGYSRKKQMTSVAEMQTNSSNRVDNNMANTPPYFPKQKRIRSRFADYGYWQPNLITDRKGEAYFMASFPDNFTRWETFVVGMDKKQRVGLHTASINAFNPLTAQLTVPRFLVEGDSTMIIGKVHNFTTDTLTIQSSFNDEPAVVSPKIKLWNTHIDKTSIYANTLDTLTATFQARSKGFEDGEKRHIPVIKKGVAENKGNLHLLDGDTLLNLTFEDTLTPVTIRIENNITDFFEGNLDYLIRYPHGCNEQTSSKLLATLLAKQLKKKRRERFQQFDYIHYGVKRLTDSQNKNGSWGWWKSGEEDIWMTTYVLNALYQAENAGFSTLASKKGYRFLATQLERQTGRNLLDILALFSTVGHKVDFEKWLQKVERTLLNPTLNDTFTLLKIKQEQSLPYDLEVVYANQQQDRFNNVFWGQSQRHWHNTQIQNTLLAYQILRKAGEYSICDRIERFFLNKRKTNGWTNTFQTAKVAATILNHHLNSSQQKESEISQLIIGNQTPIAIRNYPFEKTISANQVVKIVKKSKGTFYCSTQQTSFNQEPTPQSNYFELSTQFKQADSTVTDLKVGMPTDLIVAVKVKQAAEYVMIEVPIPSGCAYGDKVSNNRWPNQPNHEVHRAYYKEKVAIFCESLPIGTHYYRIALEPRFAGRYTLNPAKAEEMYYPIIYGRNGMKEVVVREE